MKKIALQTKDLIYIAILVALNVICAFITIPFVVPFTLQTFSIFFSLLFMGGIKGTIVIIIYILLGVCGAPVFANFNAGPFVIIGPTGGFIIGFILSGIIYSIFTKLLKDTMVSKCVSCFIGLIICYLLGTIWYMFIYGVNDLSIGNILMICVVPFIVFDIVKIVLAIIVSEIVKRAIKKSTLCS